MLYETLSVAPCREHASECGVWPSWVQVVGVSGSARAHLYWTRGEAAGRTRRGAARRGTSRGGVPARSITAVGRSDILVIKTAAASTSDFVFLSISIMEHLLGILLTLKSSFPSLTGIVGKPS